MINADQALQRLQQGNRRYLAGVRSRDTQATPSRRAELASGQNPFAAILGCADSRVPVELIFDQGPGDLFVVRVAGNVAGPSQIGSVEFAAQFLGTRLVVVLGHPDCGAVLATLDELRGPSGIESADLRSIIELIRPSVESLPQGGIQDAVRANVRAQASRLRAGSSVLQRLIHEEGLLVVGAEYSLVSGGVDFFDGLAS